MKRIIGSALLLASINTVSAQNFDETHKAGHVHEHGIVPIGVMGGHIATADPELRAGKRVEISLGGIYQPHNGAFKGNRFALEIGNPVYQKLDGSQLETDLTLTAGWQYTFLNG